MPCVHGMPVNSAWASNNWVVIKHQASKKCQYKPLKIDHWVFNRGNTVYEILHPIWRYNYCVISCSTQYLQCMYILASLYSIIQQCMFVCTCVYSCNKDVRRMCQSWSQKWCKMQHLWLQGHTLNTSLHVCMS